MKAPILALLLLAAALSLAPMAPPAAAAHWCDDIQMTVSPTTTAQGALTPFTVTVENLGTNDTTISSLEVHFSWDSGPDSDLGGGFVAAGDSDDFRTFETPTASGAQTVRVRLTGTNGGETATCEATVGTSIIGNLASAGLQFAGWLVIVAVIAVIAIVVVVVLVVVLASRGGRSGAPPQQPPAYPPPPPPGPPSG